jgi:N-acetylneuraminate synthase
MKLSDIDDLVSFFEHRGVDFAIMHCVAVYPTPDPDFHLNQIDILRRRYPRRLIGWSTHELPDDLAPVQIAAAKGATLFERHVGVPTEQQPLNTYSSSPEQVAKWIAACQRALLLCGKEGPEEENAAEIESLNSLKRGVYVTRRIEAGEFLEPEDVFFAIPYEAGQMESGKFKKGIKATTVIEPRAPILDRAVVYQANPDRLVLQDAIHEAKAMLNEANIALNSEFRTEYSHHYGIQNFRKTGAIIIDCVNREYCKKLIVQLPGQSHPLHFHKLKEETFQVLSGVMHVEVEGHHKILRAGETQLIQPGVWHRFWTEEGVIFEEISTTHYNSDSYYRDKRINRMAREERKTAVDHWGRFQLGSDQVQANASSIPPEEAIDEAEDV